MKNTGKFVAIAFAVMVFVSAANAQSLVATVPFGFQVNDQQMEAGKYIVDVDASNKVVLRPASGGGTIILTSSAGPNNGSRPESCLVFDWTARKHNSRRSTTARKRSSRRLSSRDRQELRTGRSGWSGLLLFESTEGDVEDPRSLCLGIVMPVI
jgi:hypothetical protein